MMLVALCIPFPFSTPCDAMLTMLICATHWLSMHLYTLAYTSMHKSCLLVCHPCFNTMKLWIFDPNLHLSLVDTSFCSLSCLFTHLLVCLLYCSFACHAYHTYLLYAFSYAFALLPSIACLLVCLSFCLCMYTHGVKTYGTRAWSPRQAKRGQVEACQYEPSGYVQKVQKSSFPIWLCTLLNPFLPSPFLSQMGCISYIMPCTIRPHLQGMATLVYFLALIFWVMLQECRHLLSYTMYLHCA